MRVLFLTDNELLLTRVKTLITGALEEKLLNYRFSYAYSPSNNHFKKLYRNSDWIKPINVKKDIDLLVSNYQLIISLHCKQLFPKKLVDEVRCINVHPGLNPHNRGWFPQVFSIVNGLPLGATIHEIDEKLDHGFIIAQEEVEVHSWDTSLTAYDRVLDAELRLFEANLVPILDNSYTKYQAGEGNLNLKSDFNRLCELNLDDADTLRNHINLLRALTHGDYKNAFFVDETGDKVYVSIELKRETPSD